MVSMASAPEGLATMPNIHLDIVVPAYGKLPTVLQLSLISSLFSDLWILY